MHHSTLSILSAVDQHSFLLDPSVPVVLKGFMKILTGVPHDGLIMLLRSVHDQTDLKHLSNILALENAQSIVFDRLTPEEQNEMLKKFPPPDSQNIRSSPLVNW